MEVEGCMWFVLHIARGSCQGVQAYLRLMVEVGLGLGFTWPPDVCMPTVHLLLRV